MLIVHMKLGQLVPLSFLPPLVPEESVCGEMEWCFLCGQLFSSGTMLNLAVCLFIHNGNSFVLVDGAAYALGRINSDCW